MTDLDQFLEFFDKMGVPHDEVWIDHRSGRHDRILTISQTHFHFDWLTDCFLGVQGDEMGGFRRRKGVL